MQKQCNKHKKGEVCISTLLLSAFPVAALSADAEAHLSPLLLSQKTALLSQLPSSHHVFRLLAAGKVAAVSFSHTGSDLSTSSHLEK